MVKLAANAASPGGRAGSQFDPEPKKVCEIHGGCASRRLLGKLADSAKKADCCDLCVLGDAWTLDPAQMH